jgi:arylsulfatase A-like enzyme
MLENPPLSKPNILLIVADDLGVDALRITGGQVLAQVDGPNGAQAPAPLPTLGKLLQSGIHFAHAWAQPVCSPTRASLFTGLHAWKTEVGFPATRPLPSNDVTASGAPGAPIQMLAKVLKDNAGYRCSMFGKWDLGGGEGLGGQTPLEWGWDHFEGIYGGGLSPTAGVYGLELDQDAPVSLQAPNRVSLERLRQTQDPTTKPSRDAVVAQCKAYLGKVCDPRFVEGQPDVRYFIWPKNIDDLATKSKTVDVAPFQRTHLYATADFVDSARTWIKQSSGQPWFVALTLNTPHNPYHVPPKESYRIQLPDAPSPQQMFIAMIESMDFYIGQLLNAPELQDQLKNTVIVFVGDNGTQDRDPDTGVQLDGLRGDDKASYHIGGVHVPMIVADGGLYVNSAPCYLKDALGQPTAGWRCESVVHIMDLYKTTLDIAAATPPGETDSVSMKAHLHKAGSARRYIFSQQYPTSDPELAAVGKHASVSDGTHKLSCYRTKFIDGGTSDEFTYELCELVKDPTIPGNINESQIDLNDLGFRAKLQELHGELQRQRLDSGDPKLARAPLPFPPLPPLPLVPPSITFDTTFYYRLWTMFRGSAMCLDIYNGGEYNNMPHLAVRADVSGQYWRIEVSAKPGYYRLSTMFRGDKMDLDVFNGGPFDNMLHLVPEADYSGQYWKITDSQHPDYYRLSTMFRGDNMDLDVFNGGKFNDMPHLTKEANLSGQYWRFEKTTTKV